MNAGDGEDGKRLILSSCSMALHPRIAGELAEARGDSHYL